MRTEPDLGANPSEIHAHGSPHLPFCPRHARLYDVIKARTLAAAATRAISAIAGMV
jgi:hypothetical protein